MRFDALKAVVTNWPIKLTALVLALVLWAVIAAVEPTVQLIPVTFSVDVPEGRTLTQPLPDVYASYSGTSSELQKLRISPPVIQKSVPDTLTGSQFLLELSLQDLAILDDVDVTAEDLRPRAVLVVLDDRISRNKPVVPRGVRITPDSGYEQFGGVQVTPASVVVTGPREQVDRIDRLYTVPLQLTGVTSPVQRTIAIDTANLSLVQLSRQEVEVAADVGPVTERVLMGVPVDLQPQRGGIWESSPQAVIVAVRGPTSRVVRLTRDSVSVIAAFAGGESADTVSLEVSAPQGLTATVTPDTVVVQRRGRD